MEKPNTNGPDRTRDAERIGETDIAGDVMGNNRLQGDDQLNVHNQRQAVPDAKLTADADPVESARLQDKDARAEAELNKGGGVHPHAGEDRS
ncbi:hypothetical protein [Acuticoccus sp. I52.16.1]|uniref:hypothetical protein n=1 Tax=Acuticoccus sp. I52.16.1 TaxID=2928472 RepID=UPI001FD5C622|nr:hypothetical protein [Acuticoccus sp. I52.16.1]UOM35917.1 hypothetical protein MRB58_06890 [Acuticoccus sp. I52.16.1]